MEEPFLSLTSLRRELQAGPWRGGIRAQAESVLQKESTQGKPFYELRLRDALDSIVLRAWSDAPAYPQCARLSGGEAIAVTGEFYDNGQFGPDARKWTLRLLNEEESAEFFSGDPALREAVERDFLFIRQTIEGVGDPRLQTLGLNFLGKFGERFCRAAAARSFHHARRGGLCEHTAQMMRAALALSGVYAELNRDLLVTGVLFHDCGKLWETCPPEQGFAIPVQSTGEMLGHISIGIELINRLWGEMEGERTGWEAAHPGNEEVRLHLLHLVAAHHGELQFGSPVEPRTPEAMALHYIDNLDAKLEMVRAGYATLPDVAPGITDRARPLNVRLARPLPPFQAASAETPPGEIPPPAS